MMVGCGRDQRRAPLRHGLSATGGSGGVDSGIGGEGGEAGRLVGSFPNFGELGEPNEDGVRVPPGYQARIVAVSGEEVPGSGGYIWHDFPDGAATFPHVDGGYIYVSNSEISTGGGVGAIRFDAGGNVVDAYSICRGTRMNCQGGATPGGKFLTCEEVPTGLVYECDPLGLVDPIVRPGLGVFRHEGLAYDPETHIIYLSEDEVDGCFYRYRPDGLRGGEPDIRVGVMEVASVDDRGAVTWLEVPDPTFSGVTPTRGQVARATAFRGGEGIWWREGKVYLTTKGDNRVWEYDVQREEMNVLYDASTARNPVLTGVDTIIGTTGGELLVAEDAGDMQVVVILPSGELRPLLQIEGQSSSEVTGLAFEPYGQKRLYFSSQRGNARGITYEMTGPFAVDA